jgi:hypothetical protein
VAATTMAFGVLMVLLGVGGFVATGSTHYTALIPAAFGVLFLLLGALARNSAYRKHVMHAAAALALVGFFAVIRGVVKLVQWLTGTPPPAERQGAVISQSIMAALLLIFLVMCVKSFVDARRARRAGVTSTP